MRLNLIAQPGFFSVMPASFFILNSLMSFSPSRLRFHRYAVAVPVTGALLFAWSVTADARNLIGGRSTAAPPPGSSASPAAASQTATAATDAAAQAAQAAVQARRAQDSLVRSTVAFQNLAAAQAAARLAAIKDPTKIIRSTDGSKTDGLAPGLLEPAGGVPATTTPGVQIVDLGGAGNNELSLSNGGTIALPKGTKGTEQVTLSGAGSVTGGAVTAHAGSVTTSSGGTLAATNGGSISLTAGACTLTSSSATTITSTLGGTISLPQNGWTIPFSANQSVTIPAGSSVSFTGSGSGTVSVVGSGTVKLTGAGTLSLAGAASGSGGTITTNTGASSFTNGAVTSLPAGSTIAFSGSGGLTFQGSGTDKLPVIVEPNVSGSSSGLTLTTPAFTTTGSVLNTTGYVTPATWTGVSALSESVTASGKDIVTVTQDQQQALLNWNTFNIGKNTVLDFDQSAGGVNVGNWVAINRVLDPSLAPSKILGAINAPGQVYVINQNGIIFTGSSEVNAHALVASSLPMNTNLIASGLLNNPNGQFLFTSVLDSTAQNVTQYDPNTDPNALPNATSGPVSVEEGAIITSPGSPEGVGGKIALIGPDVTNQGTLSASAGQIILAAGQQVGFVAHPSTDPSLRGLDVAVGQPGGTGSGNATNGEFGIINADQADVTMTGSNVNQFGFILAGTSVSLNGRIDLMAVTNLAPDALHGNIFDSSGNNAPVAGKVDLGPNSLTLILPDYASTATAVGPYLALPSQIYVAGQSFEMQNGAQMIAPNATATFSIGILNTTIVAAPGVTTVPLPENTGAFPLSGQPVVAPVYLASADPATVTLDAGANLDVSGSSNVQASVTENIVAAQLTAAILANSPLQADGPLHGATVQVDISQTGTNADGSIWYGSPIGDLSGYKNLIQLNVGELTIAGGSVAINTSGSVNLQPGSTVNVSGGSINYAGATVATTKVVTANGQVLDISKATPDQAYTGLATGFATGSSKWGASQSFTNGLEPSTYYDPGYTQGGNGGSLSINSSGAAFAGDLFGNVTTGARQQVAPPVFSKFSFNVQPAIDGLVNPPAIDVIIQPASDPQTSPGALYLSSDLFGLDGFSNATINTGSGAIQVSSDAVIFTAAGGSLDFTGNNIVVEGQIVVPAGTINLTALTKDTIDRDNPVPYDPAIGNITVGANGVVATTGLAFDELSSTTAGTLTYSVNGGKVTLNGAATTLMAGSIVDASGGAARDAAGKIHSGTGGSIALTGVYTNQGDVSGQLVLDGSLTAYGIGKGGTLKLNAPEVQVGTGTPQSLPGGVNTLVLSPDFFSQGGFSNFSVTGVTGFEVAGNTAIAPVLMEEVAYGGGTQFGLSLMSSASFPSYPAAPVSLSFTASGIGGGATGVFSLDAGSSITTGPTGSVNLSGQLVNILGNITAPGGSITIAGDSTQQLGAPSGVFTQPKVSVYLGPGATLSTAGTVLTTPVPLNHQIYQTGQVLAGGQISITGNIVGDATASLIADGTQGALDVPIGQTAIDLQPAAFQRALTPYVHEQVASNGGSISLNGIELLYFAGNLSARAGGATAIGGTLSIGSGIASPFPDPSTGAPYPAAGFAELFLSQHANFGSTTVTLGQTLSSIAQQGGGTFSVDQFSNGGFGSLVLNGNVEFQGGNIDITASQKVVIVPDSLNGTVFADGSNETITINAPYISIGAPTLEFGTNNTLQAGAFAPSYASINLNGVATTAAPIPGLAAPTYGDATFNLNAIDLLDVQFLSLQNIGNTNFNVSQGDIRGGGLLYAAGNLNLTAGQIYTPTAATFTMAAFDAVANGATVRGTVDIESNGVARPLPLSAGGTLNVYGTNIVQNGTLAAPFGTINLGAAPDATTGLTPIMAGVTIAYNGLNLDYEATPDYTQHAPVTENLTLGAHSITTVSGVSSDGVALELPYGTILNGGQWIAPNGADITAGGLPAKAVHLGGTNITNAAGSVIDLDGGGDLFAYQFSPGVGGTNDILNIFKYANGAVVTSTVNGASQSVASTSFAILPAYGSNGVNYAPIDLTIDSNGNFPYANAGLTSQVGNQVYLEGGDGLAAGLYTILPARYALLPGALLVTPTSGAAPTSTSVNPDGSLAMAGYLQNTLNRNQQLQPTVTGFNVEPSTVVHSRAEYDISLADAFLKAGALNHSQAVPRLPMDAGQLVFFATQAFHFQEGATVLGGVADGGLGSQVDVASSGQIEINSTGTDASFNGLVLNSADLDSINAGSLLVGGYRQSTSSGTQVIVTTQNLVVDNAGGVLQAGDVVLVSNGNLTVRSGSTIASVGDASAENLSILNGTTSNSDGALLRVSGDISATISRKGGIDLTDLNPSLSVEQGATLSGNAVTLDSTGQASLGATLQDVNSISIGAGRISVELDNGETLQPNPGLVLSAATIAAFQSSAQALALASYTSIDFYGSGTIGGPADSTGQFPVASLTLDAGAIRGFSTVNGGNAGGGSVVINAQNVMLNNAINGIAPAPTGIAAAGSLAINAGSIQFGANAATVDGYAATLLTAANDMVATSVGSLTTGGALTLATPLITGATGVAYSFNAGGDLDITQPAQSGTPATTGGLGATLSLTGATVTVGSKIAAASGTINIQAMTGNVELQSGGVLDVSGRAITFGSAASSSNGGQVNVISANGNVALDAGSLIDVSAPSSGGNAGTVSITASNGILTMAEQTLKGSAAHGTAGTFKAKVSNAPLVSALATPAVEGGFQSIVLDIVSGQLVTVDQAVGPALGQNGLASFSLTAEQGAITVDSAINASGVTGGTIQLYGNLGVTLTGNAALTVEGQQFNSAGQGGLVDIETRGGTGIDIASGAQVNLKVDYLPVLLPAVAASATATGTSLTLTQAVTFVLPGGTPGNDQLQFSSGGTITAPDGTTTAFAANQVLANLAAGSKITLSNPGSVTFVPGGTGGAVAIDLPSGANFTASGATNLLGTAALTAAQAGDFGGTLHLRAPTTSGGTDLAINSNALANANIIGDSTNIRVVVEGYNVYNAANNGGQIDGNIEGSAQNGAAGTVYGDAGTFAGNTSAILSRLLGVTTPTAAQMAEYQVTPGAEIINADTSVNGGSLTLGSDWDLSSFRFGPNGVAGILTLRAANNLVFNGSLTDGFAYNSLSVENVATSPYTWDVMSGPSWSYRLVAGAQFAASGDSAANYEAVQSLAQLNLDPTSQDYASQENGSLLLGQTIPVNQFNTTNGYGTLTSRVAATYAQLIRTGAGSITIDTGGSVDLLNQLVSIYTAGQATTALAGFDLPTGNSDSTYQTSVYGRNISPAPQYAAQYTAGGGSVSINAQVDIAHLTKDPGGNVVADTSWQFPTNWLYRRGATSSSGIFDTTMLGGKKATTTWWIDFSNFFEGIGALGGGNVTVSAGRNIVNVDAVVPTNARMPYADASGNALPAAASTLVELGGGNLSVTAGGTIQGGTYYVEQGTGAIAANTISSAGDTARISAHDLNVGQNTALPLTLFVGNSSFTVAATNDVSIGSAVNPFWLPQGMGNNFINESIFSTYASDSSVGVSSLLGNITIQGSEAESTPLPGSLFNAYLSNASNGNNRGTATKIQSENATPWTLTLDPTSVGTNFIDNVTNYSLFYELNPPTFGATAFSGSIQYNGDQILAPSAHGTLQLLAAGAVGGAFNSPSVGNGLTATITVLDDDPSQLPGVTNPFGLGLTTVEPPQRSRNNPSIGAAIGSTLALLGETPTYANQSFTTLQQYHTPGLLHDDPGTPPVEIRTINGSISDFMLLSPEKVAITSGLDLQDVSFYIQNNAAADISVITANRDITLFDPNSPALIALGAANSFFTAFGDLQVSGPGTVEILAGRNLNLGEGQSPNGVNQPGTGLGVTTIGQSRNPYLPFGGANIIAAAGLGDTSGLDGSTQLTFGNVTSVNGNVAPQNPTGYGASFIGQYLDPATSEGALYLPELGVLMGLPAADTNDQIWTAFSQQSNAEQDRLATDIFYNVLRDSGRDHNNPSSPNAGTYAQGYAAIAALFPASNTYRGDISLTSREFKTTNGGDINLLMPGGGLDVGLNNNGTQAIDQGILTVDGGNIAIFVNNNVDLGTSRIFTLHGGNVVIWSSTGDIDAGASSRTVQSAPPTRVLVDSASANVQTDLAGLATGGGIGVLETVVGAPPGNVDLIAPVGTINAGDAGIRSSGNINIAAAHVVNAGNIQAGGSTTGVPTTTAPSISGAIAASSVAGSSQNAASQAAMQQQRPQTSTQAIPSIISVEVIGYGGGDDDSASTAPDPNAPKGT